MTSLTKSDPLVISNINLKTYNLLVFEITLPAYLSMLWFRDCARKVSEQGQKIMWLTPLNLPCVQHYAKQYTKVPFKLFF